MWVGRHAPHGDGTDAGPPWNIVVGGLLMAVAAWVMLDPDYPMASAGHVISSEFSPAELMPSPTEPVGFVTDVDNVEFAWDWAGERPSGGWRLELFDADLSPLCGVDWPHGSPLPLSPALRSYLARGTRFHWRIVPADPASRTPGSRCVAFELR